MNLVSIILFKITNLFMTHFFLISLCVILFSLIVYEFIQFNTKRITPQQSCLDITVSCDASLYIPPTQSIVKRKTCPFFLQEEFYHHDKNCTIIYIHLLYSV